MMISNKLPQVAAKAPQSDSASVTQKIVDATVDKTLAGTDRFSGMLAGIGTSTVAYVGKLPSVAAHGVESLYNLQQSEVIGPNIKVVAGILSPVIVAGAVVAAGAGLAASVVTGAVRGVTAHDSDKPRDFTIGKAVDDSWSNVRSTMDDLSSGMVKGSAEVRAQKLAEGQDPWDIPLPPFGRTAKTIAATVAGVVIGGVGGLATAVAVTGKEAWGGLKQAVTKIGTTDSLAGLATMVAAPVTGVLHGASKVFTTPVAAAAVAWKEKSLGGALKAAGKESFDTETGKVSSAVGSLVGGAVAAVPSALGAFVDTTLTDLGNGLKTAFTDKDLNLAGKALTAVGSVVSAPVSGLVHTAATLVTTPFSSMASGWDKKNLTDGMAHGVEAGRTVTRPIADTVGAFTGGLVVGGITAASTTAVGLVSEVSAGIIDAATNKDLNVRGKVLAGLGGIPGNAITAVGQGLGALVISPFTAAGSAIEEKSVGAGIKASAQYGTGAFLAAAAPEKTMVK